MKLVYSKQPTREVQVGDEVQNNDAEHFIVSGIENPHKPASTGRLYVRQKGDVSGVPANEQGFYPSVFGMTWIESEDQEEINTPQDFVTRDVAVEARPGQEFYHRTKRNADGSAMRIRVNGKCQTWKTRPGDFRLPIKYGLKECGEITHRENVQWLVESPTLKSHGR